MAKNPDKFLKKLIRDNKIHKRIQKTMLVLSLFVILGVFWSLKLTGITMAGEAFCGKDEHVHGDNCPTGSLICPLIESEPHIHGESCIFRELICTETEREGHIHTAECEGKVLLCTEQTVANHVHTSSCEKWLLVCQEEEVRGHKHEEPCWDRHLTCTTEETEGHAHADGCWQEALICGLEENADHTHEDSCREMRLICEIPEIPAHFHEDACYTQTLVCTEEEVTGHTHGAECYVLEEGYSCGLHMHTPECYAEKTVSICGLQEDPGHTHEDGCYQFGIGFGCGLTEAEGHVHTPDCVTGETEIACGKEATEGHIHGEACYEAWDQCRLEEHIHDESCYSDINADLETEADWERSLQGLPISSFTAENVVAVAQSQLGCGESQINFQVDESGIRRGITRYGQWYGNPYGDWSAMFVSFCLHYAGVEDVPANAGPESMRLEWVQAGLYVNAAEYAPRYGDVLFLHLPAEAQTAEAAAEEAPMPEAETQTTEETQPAEAVQTAQQLSANKVAIITGFDGEMITVIEGDVDGKVAETSYPADDPMVLGYGMVPEDPDFAVLLLPRAGVKPVAQTVSYNANNFTNQNRFVLYVTSNGVNYAIDGTGNAVSVSVENGVIYTDLEDPTLLQWTFTRGSGNNNWFVKNVATGRYLHAFTNNGGGVTTTSEYVSNVTNNTSGMLVRSNNEYARLDSVNKTFVPTSDQSQAVRYKLGMSTPYTVWLDGTAGGQGQLGGSLNQKYTVNYGDTIVMPSEWQVPEKYSQQLRGWYDVTNQVYYAPGTEVTVTGNMVFYADWTAASYDVGQYNAQVANTISTNAFVTTHLFDYNYLFNVMSANAKITVDANSHSETWSMVDNGNVDYQDQKSLEFVFVDYDGSSRLPDMSGRNDANNYHGVGVITQGIYTPELADILFNPGNSLNPETGEGIIGKTYVGTADHMFQFMDDPNDEYFGYYYYDSHRNAASYNSSAGRFYIYEYLEATSDSLNSDNRSDFLPFNSPYANTNGKTVRTYTDAGGHGEYQGTTHYRYDSKYSDNNNGTNYVSTNYAFGMRMDVQFYLPNQPGVRGENGEYGNKDLYGRDMHFEFKGDDDVWVLVDGVLVLDIGGIHGVEGGDINFATGVVTVNGSVDNTLSARLKEIKDGEHTLTFMYLERGSSQSNCAFFFNLAPRFSLTIQKEDVLTQELLNGAQFSIFRDSACTVPAQLWESEAAHDSGSPATNVFTVRNGVANIWGLASGNTYYIKETKPPDAEAYDFTNGIIRLTIDKDGIATYDVEIISDGSNGISNGFTVHGVRIDEETQSAYIVATNAPEWVKEVTTVQTMKQWMDGQDHSGDYVTAYLTVTDPDGTVRRIREILLSEENDWEYTWTNLPKFAADGVTPIQYGIQEAYVPGYQGVVEEVEEFSIVKETWAEAVDLKGGQTYVIRSGNGYLSTTGAGSDTGYKWVDEATAKSSPYALWTTTGSKNTYKLTNGAGQTITFYYGNGSPTDFYASTGGESNNAKQYFTPAKVDGGIRLYYDAPNNRDYYLMSSMNNSGKFSYSTNSRDGMTLVPLTQIKTTHTEAVTGWGFQINNTPLTEETSLEVLKAWENPLGDDPTLYQTEQVTIRLLANGQDTGRTVTLNLKNNWRDTFRGLPAKDAQGNTIVYTVEESWQTTDWTPSYGEIITIGTQNPIYTTTVTNIYRVGGPILPTTGSAGRMLYILCGLGIMLSSLVGGLVYRRMRERRRK